MSEVKSPEDIDIRILRMLDKEAVKILDKIMEAIRGHCGELYRDEDKYYECIAGYADKSLLEIAEELEGYKEPYIPHYMVEALRNMPKKQYDILENYFKKEFKRFLKLSQELNRFLKIYKKRLALQTA